MLDERKAAILRAVVQEHIETAQPVGSVHVARAAGLRVSPATVRNEMSFLEQEGFLVQPHTSAGRIPTDKGYRFFVDQLSAPGALSPPKRQRVRDFFNQAHGELEQMLDDTSRLLSNLTDYAAVVVGPTHELATVRSVQLVPLGPRTILAVAVLSNGVVEKRTLDFDRDVDATRVAAASAHLAAHLDGRTLADTPVPTTGDQITDDLGAAARQALTADSDHVFVGGASRVAAAFDAVETVRQVLATLEQQYLMLSLLREVLDGRLSVSIGEEHGDPLAECAVIVAPYEVEGEPIGTIGVLGPTRMNYPQAMAAVAMVSQALGLRLRDSG